MRQLRKLATEKKLRGRSKMNKKELVEALFDQARSQPQHLRHSQTYTVTNLGKFIRRLTST